LFQALLLLLLLLLMGTKLNLQAADAGAAALC